MILGSVSFKSETNKLRVSDDISETVVRDSLSFNQVQGTGLTGGYFTASGLPYSHEDFYFSDPIKNILVLMSGSVYNIADLVTEDGPERKLPLPELIALLFLKRGPEFIRDLNGDFTVYIELSAKKEAWLFRDHVGIRPLAYAADESSLYFSSDSTALARHLSGDSDLDPEYLMDSFKYVDLRRTPINRVKKLPPGHFLRYSDGKAEVKRYWDPGKVRKDKLLTHDRMLRELKALLADAVKIRCDSRFIAGAHVSGGLDSGIVAALARSGYSHQGNFYGFSWSPAEFVPDDSGHDERDLVRSFCKGKLITPIFSDLDAENFIAETANNHTGRIYFSENRVIKQASERGVNLIFSGWGGDDFISTADRGIEIDLLRALRLRLFFRRNPIIPFRKFVKYLLSYVLYPYFGVLPKSVRRFFKERARYLKKPFRKSDRRAVRYFYFFRSRRQLHLRLLALYHIQERCESWSVYGYRHGIEYRYPLLDKRIIEYMLAVPSELLCKTDYYRPLLREISENILPGEVRFNWSKDDYVFQAHMKELYKEAATELIGELPEWKLNKELSFIDYKLLEEDLSKIGRSGTGRDADILFRSLVFIKAAHSFLIEFKKQASLNSYK